MTTQAPNTTADFRTRAQALGVEINILTIPLHTISKHRGKVALWLKADESEAQQSDAAHNLLDRYEKGELKTDAPR